MCGNCYMTTFDKCKMAHYYGYSTEFPKNLKIKLYVPVIILWIFIPPKMKLTYQKEITTPMFISALFKRTNM